MNEVVFAKNAVEGTENVRQFSTASAVLYRVRDYLEQETDTADV